MKQIKKYKIIIEDKKGIKVEKEFVEKYKHDRMMEEAIASAELANPDFVSSCCGSTIKIERNMQPELYTCDYCHKPCQIEQLPDVSVLKVSTAKNGEGGDWRKEFREGVVKEYKLEASLMYLFEQFIEKVVEKARESTKSQLIKEIELLKPESFIDDDSLYRTGYQQAKEDLLTLLKT